jgi:integrase
VGDIVNPQAGKEKVKDFAERWLDSRRGVVAEKTHITDEYLLRVHIPKKLANMPISSVLTMHVEEVLRDLARSKRLTTVNRFHGTLSSMFGAAVRQKIIRLNPVSGAAKPRSGASPAREIMPFTVEELEDVFQVQRAIDPSLAEVVLVLGLAGMRWGELKALRVADFQRIPYPALIVRRSAPDGVAERPIPKSGRSRLVPVVDRIIPIIEARLEGKQPGQLLFENTVGGPLHGSNLRRRLKWSITAQGRRIHDLRHTAATNWLRSGVEPRTVQEWLGHSSMRITDIYSHHLGTAADVAALKKMNEMLGSAGGASTEIDEDSERGEAL